MDFHFFKKELPLYLLHLFVQNGKRGKGEDPFGNSEKYFHCSAWMQKLCARSFRNSARLRTVPETSRGNNPRKPFKKAMNLSQSLVL